MTFDDFDTQKQVEETKEYRGYEEMEELKKEEPNREFCLECGESVAFGSGRFVNRIPADTPEDDPDRDASHLPPEMRQNALNGEWLCAGCLSRTCDRCDGSIPMDEDIWVHDTAGNDLNICEDCLKPTDKVDD